MEETWPFTPLHFDIFGIFVISYTIPLSIEKDGTFAEAKRGVVSCNSFLLESNILTQFCFIRLPVTKSGLVVQSVSALCIDSMLVYGLKLTISSWRFRILVIQIFTCAECNLI